MVDPEAVDSTEKTPLVPKKHVSLDEDAIEMSVSAVTPKVWEDAWDTVVLGAPIFVSMLSWVGMKTTDSALLGHVSREALAAAALSDLWTMCTTPLVNGQVLGILVGGAVGAGNPKLAGIYLQVSYAVLSGIVLVVMISWMMTEKVWLAFGSDPEISRMAGYYATVLAVSVPGELIFTQLAQFFSAQRIMHPEVNASSFALFCNLALGLFFVLGIPLPGFQGFGFKACPLVTSTVVYLQLLLMWYVYVHRQRLHETCWDGWAWKEITWERAKTFSALYFPAALGMASDFWRVAVVGAVAAKLGEEEVAVFNTSYRIMWIVLVVVMALSGASGINMSIRLGRMDHRGAKQAGYIGVAMSGLFCSLIGLAVWVWIRTFGRIFTNDEIFLGMFEECRTPFIVTLILMNMSIAIEKIPYSMGRTTEVFWYGLVASWGAQVPAVILCTVYWRDDLVGLYTGMAIGYGVLVLLYSWIAFTSDWKKYAQLARMRSESMETEDSEKK